MFSPTSGRPSQSHAACRIHPRVPSRASGGAGVACSACFQGRNQNIGDNGSYFPPHKVRGERLTEDRRKKEFRASKEERRLSQLPGPPTPDYQQERHSPGSTHCCLSRSRPPGGAAPQHPASSASREDRSRRAGWGGRGKARRVGTGHLTGPRGHVSEIKGSTVRSQLSSQRSCSDSRRLSRNWCSLPAGSGNFEKSVWKKEMRTYLPVPPQVPTP